MSKKKRKKQKPKPRTNEIISKHKIVVPEGAPVIIGYDKGEITITNGAGHSYDSGPYTMIRSYRGENRDKVVAKSPPLDYMTSRVDSWIENFDYIFAIDTNTKPEVNNRFICSAGFVYFGEISKTAEHKGEIHFSPYMCIEWYYKEPIKIEPYSWAKAIEYLQTVIPADKRVGVVIDSELDKFDGYNERTIPVIDSWYLPQNYTFLFATADNSDEWCNKIIKKCDKMAGKILDEIRVHPNCNIFDIESPVLHGYATIFDKRTF